MRPEDIQNRDFLVGLRGYDKDEVRAFLAEVAAEHASLLAAVESGPTSAAVAAPAPSAPANDDFESLGAGVAAILRTAKEQAAEITNDAQTRAAAARDEAESIRQRATESAEALREQVDAEVQGLRQRAEQQVADARAEAERIVREATDRVRQIEVEHEARMNNRVEEITRREAATRARLVEAADELQLALVALGEGGEAHAEPDSDQHEQDSPPLG